MTPTITWTDNHDGTYTKTTVTTTVEVVALADFDTKVTNKQQQITDLDSNKAKIQSAADAQIQTVTDEQGVLTQEIADLQAEKASIEATDPAPVDPAPTDSEVTPDPTDAPTDSPTEPPTDGSQPSDTPVDNSGN